MYIMGDLYIDIDKLQLMDNQRQWEYTWTHGYTMGNSWDSLW